MTDLGGAASPRTEKRVYQCPGCWSVTTNPMTENGYECDCGERLFRIDLRDTEPSPFLAAQEAPAPEGLRAAWPDLDYALGVALGSTDHPLLLRLRALAATPPTPAEPPRSAYQEGWRDGTLDRLGLAEARPPEGLDAVLTAATILCSVIERLPDYGNKEWLMSLTADLREALAARPTPAEPPRKVGRCVHGDPCRERSCPEYRRAEAPPPEGLDTLIEDGKRWRAAEAEGHTVTFDEDGYGLQHPPSCRPNLIDCPYNAHLADLGYPAEEPGRYRMTKHKGHFEYARLSAGGATKP